MTLSEYDQERLRMRYLTYCQKNGIAYDLFDFNAELDRTLTYWEAWAQIEDKLSLLTNSLNPSKSEVQSMKDQEQCRNSSAEKDLVLDLDKTDSVAILGDRNSGKSNLAFYLLNAYRGTKQVYLYGYPSVKKGFKNVSTWEDLLRLTDSIIFVDEIHKFIRLYDRQANTEFMELLSFLAQQNNTLMFTTQLSQFITKGVEASIQTWLIKQLDILGLKNGSKPKRIIRQTADARITDKGIALNVNEVIAYDSLQGVGFNGIYTFKNQGVGKEWKKTPYKTATKTPTKTANKIAEKTAQEVKK